MLDFNALLSDVLARPKNAVFYELNGMLQAGLPDRFVLETEDSDFNYEAFAHEGHCIVRPLAEAKNHLVTSWYVFRDDDYDRLENGCATIEWQGASMLVLRTGNHLTDHCRTEREYLIAPSEKVARDFFAAVCRWNNEIRGEVLVFSNGRWDKSESLYQSIQGTTLDNLVLPPSFKSEVRENVSEFFGAESTYTKYGLPWKRGLLFFGPPGNGKTHMIKGLANELAVPCLYVRSFTSRYNTPHENIGRAFARARQSAPCLFILEDLDALVDDRNRSYFLNEMDGFYSNRGILTIATTNHPEKLDPAILERPSRFDRKFTFTLPEEGERLRYLDLLNANLEPELRLDDEGLAHAAHETGGFSYAYLKELVLSSMMAWIREEGRMPMNGVLASQIASLAGQMRTEMTAPTPAANVPDDDEAEDY